MDNPDSDQGMEAELAPPDGSKKIIKKQTTCKVE